MNSSDNETPSEEEKLIVSQIRTVFSSITEERKFYTIPELEELTKIGYRRLDTILECIQVLRELLDEYDVKVVEDTRRKTKGLVLWRLTEKLLTSFQLQKNE